ncbi:MAG: hypothetical protein AAF564_06290 [Bacteroidota bacterium]
MPIPSSVEHARPVADQARRLLAFLQYSNLHIVVVALGLLSGTSTLFGTGFSVPVVLAGCCGAFLLYQLDRGWLPGKEDGANQPERVAWIARHHMYVWSSCAFALLAGLIGTAFLSGAALLAGALLAGCGFAYVLPLRKRLKRIWYVKPVAIAGAWALGGVALPLVEMNFAMAPVVLIFLGYRFFFILPNVLLADWQDRLGDEQAGLHSLAMLVDERMLRLMAAGSALVAIMLGGWCGVLLGWSALFFIDLAGPLLMLLLCLRPLHASYLVYGLLLDLLVAWPLITTLLVYNW